MPTCREAACLDAACTALLCRHAGCRRASCSGSHRGSAGQHASQTCRCTHCLPVHAHPGTRLLWRRTQVEWLDCAAEEKAGRLKWVPKDQPVASSAQEAEEALQQAAARPRIGRRERGAGEEGTPGESVGPQPETGGEALVGRRIGIWWPQDACFYYGSLEAFAEGEAHRVNILSSCAGNYIFCSFLH